MYWGDTHIHTVLSFDANMQGTRTTQADAYAFARGEPISLQPYTEDGTETRTAQKPAAQGWSQKTATPPPPAPVFPTKPTR